MSDDKDFAGALAAGTFRFVRRLRALPLGIALALLVGCGGGGGGSGGDDVVPEAPATVSMDDPASVSDGDGDGVRDGDDNCALVANPGQEDADLDGEGNACDATPTGVDTDGDGVSDVPDNCPLVPNAAQGDVDGDGEGDDCDDTPNGPDADRDGRPDGADNCPFVPNADQADGDGDGTGDVCEQVDPDRDGDGVPNESDNCPTDANGRQSDADGDGAGDVCDPTPFPDRDGDGVIDRDDNCPALSNGDQRDTDGDRTGDVCDDTPEGPDDDGDGVPDIRDNCPTDANADQLDEDGDGIGQVCDTVGDPPAPENPSVLGTLERDGRFGTFLETARRFGIDALLDDPEIALTVLAPPDSAFDALEPAVRDAIFGDPPELEAVVQRHIVDEGAIDSGGLAERFSMGIALFGLNGDDLVLDAPDVVQGYDLTELDIRVGPSVIHVIDGVISPLAEDGIGPVGPPAISQIDEANFEDLAEAALDVAIEELGSDYHANVAALERAAEFPGQMQNPDVFLTTVIRPEFGGTRAVYFCAGGGMVTRGRSGSRAEGGPYRAGRVFDDCVDGEGTRHEGSHFETGSEVAPQLFTVLDEFDLVVTDDDGGATLRGEVRASPTARGEASVGYTGFAYELRDDGRVYALSGMSGGYRSTTNGSADTSVRLDATLRADGGEPITVSIDLMNAGSGPGPAGLSGTVRLSAPDGSSATATGTLSGAEVELIDSAGVARRVGADLVP